MPDPSNPGTELWKGLNWTPTPEQQQQFLTLQELLRDWNSRVNLTRLVEGDDFWINQIFDSLWPLSRELQHADRRQVIQLSGGMKRRVSFAISLIAAPKVVFLDEPTTGLDPETKRHMYAKRKEQDERRTRRIDVAVCADAARHCCRVDVSR